MDIYQEVVTYHPEITLFPKDLDPVGLSMAEVLPADIAAQQMDYLTEALHTGTLKTYEHQICMGDQIRDEEVRVLKSGEDEVLFMVRDISDRKQAERQLQNLIEGTPRHFESGPPPSGYRWLNGLYEPRGRLDPTRYSRHRRGGSFFSASLRF